MAHHWMLASPSGSPKVKGTCKKCHATRDFLAAPEEGKEGWTSVRMGDIYARRDNDKWLFW